MNKVLQADRPRDSNNSDRGVIALLDGRFMQEEYVTLFPNDWEEVYPCYLENVDIPVGNFGWSSYGEFYSPTQVISTAQVGHVASIVTREQNNYIIG